MADKEAMEDEQTQRPSVGPVPLFHQCEDGASACRYCDMPISLWKPMEKCKVREVFRQQEEGGSANRM